MKITIFLTLLFQACRAAGTEITLKCEDIKPRYSALRTMRMQPKLRDKVWLSGTPKAELTETCDPYGMKTGEAQYSQKNLQNKRKLVYKDREAAGLFCKNRRSEEKLTTSFSEEARSSLDDFCRDQKKSDFDAVFVYDDATKGDGSDTEPFKRIFRTYNTKGFPVEEYFFDPASALETKKIYKHDAKNNLTEITELDFDGNQIRKETFSFNKTTASKTRSVYGATNEVLEKIVSEYREDSTLRREIRYSYDAGGQMVSKKEIYSSASGAAQKELVYQGDLEKPAYEYHYSYTLDSKGNWTEERKTRFIFFNGKAMADTQAAPEITKREIIYY